MPDTAAPDRAEPARRLELDGVVVEHRDTAGRRFVGLDLPRLAVAPGETVGIVGPSGAGKTTLLEAIAGLRVPDRGAVRWGDLAVSALGEGARDAWRRGSVGFVFQDFDLVPELSALDNVLLPAGFARFRVPRGTRARAAELIASVGLSDPGRRAGLLSRGEQQRVAIARALLADPPLILADEPTASLDAGTGAAIADLLLARVRRRGATLVVASHDRALTGRLDRVVTLVAGRVREAA